MTEAQPPIGPAGSGPSRRHDGAHGSPTRADEIGHASFPASDPPAAWTWELKSAEEKTAAKAQIAE